MANIGYFVLFRHFFDEIDDCWLVLGTHLFPGEIPVIHIFLGIVLGMAFAVSSASAIAKPDIISLPRQDESRRYFWLIHDPLDGVEKLSMLQEDDRFLLHLDIISRPNAASGFVLNVFRKHSRNPIKGQLVSIPCGDLIFPKPKPILHG